MNFEGRLKKIEKVLEEVRQPEDELQKIFEYLKSKKFMAYGPAPEIGWKWPARPYTDKETMNKARGEFERHTTLEALRRCEAWMTADLEASRPALEAAIARCEAEREAKCIPPEPEPPPGLNPGETLQWMIHYGKFKMWRKAEEEKQKVVQGGPPQPSPPSNNENQENQVSEVRNERRQFTQGIAFEDENIDPGF